jgi:DNA-binding transcriptional ArsR family regulator
VPDPRALAAVARLLGDESRAAMCTAMLDGRAWTVGELADEAGIRKAAASEHVTRLAGAGVVLTETCGRNKYVRLAGPQVAEALEALGVLASEEPPTSLRAVRDRRQLAAARTCYDHLAGRLGVAVTDALVDRRLLRLRPGLALTEAGRAWFLDLGVDVVPLERGRRAPLRTCLDLTERRPHLAGALGAALFEVALAREWVRRPARGRALELTCRGERVLEERLGITPADLAVGARPGGQGGGAV